jgi:phosphoribosylaminoimidazole-succinocarboxamide synthase
VVCERLEMYPVECVARGYLAGSGLAEYQTYGEVCGIPLPAGLQDGSRLPEPIFTPATKAALGEHDENVDFDAVAEEVGDDAAAELRMLTLAVYGKAEEIARGRGIILADTKLEFGTIDGRLLLIDEILTPDSSRFWPADEYEPGTSPPSFDKQFVRQYLLDVGWDGSPPPPNLPDDVVAGTRSRYIEAYEQLTEASFDDWYGVGD